MGMRLNSSKQAQAPTAANPLKNFDITAASNPSLQLYTMHCCPKALDKSFVVSVFPVPVLKRASKKSPNEYLEIEVVSTQEIKKGTTHCGYNDEDSNKINSPLSRQWFVIAVVKNKTI